MNKQTLFAGLGLVVVITLALLAAERISIRLAAMKAKQSAQALAAATASEQADRESSETSA